MILKVYRSVLMGFARVKSRGTASTSVVAVHVDDDDEDDVDDVDDAKEKEDEDEESDTEQGDTADEPACGGEDDELQDSVGEGGIIVPDVVVFSFLQVIISRVDSSEVGCSFFGDRNPKVFSVFWILVLGHTVVQTRVNMDEEETEILFKVELVGFELTVLQVLPLPKESLFLLGTESCCCCCCCDSWIETDKSGIGDKSVCDKDIVGSKVEHSPFLLGYSHLDDPFPTSVEVVVAVSVSEEETLPVATHPKVLIQLSPKTL